MQSNSMLFFIIVSKSTQLKSTLSHGQNLVEYTVFIYLLFDYIYLHCSIAFEETFETITVISSNFPPSGESINPNS